MKPLAQIMIEDIQAVLEKYRGEGVTYVDIVGALEMIKFDMIVEAVEDNDDEEGAPNVDP